METIKLNEIFRKEKIKEKIKEAIIRGDIFIYPTDTIYGVGCNSNNIDNVKKICKAKNRSLNKPFSVIVPSKEWIEKNTEISKNNMVFVDRLLPGPYTIVLKAKKSVQIPKIVISDEGTIGVRIPKNEFTDFIREQNALFITTSVNMSEEEPVTSIKEIPDQIKNTADWVIDAGELKNPPSRVFDLTANELKISRY
jgi:L-threonylcarbamoyladenylate synthase